MPSKKPPKRKAPKKASPKKVAKRKYTKRPKQKEIVETYKIPKRKRTRGRPSTYDKRVHPILVEEYMDSGMYPVEVAAAFGITEETLYNWARIHPEFSESFKKGKDYKRAWMTRKARKNLTQAHGQTFNATTWSMLMRMDGYTTDSRVVKLSEKYKNATTQEEKAGIISDMLADGEITPKEATLITNKILADVSITEHTAMAEKLKEVIKKLEEKK